MGTLTTGNIKAGALESSDSPAPNTYVSFANSTVTTYDSTAYTAGGQEIETFDFTEIGLSTGEAFVYEKSGAGKLQGYPGFCVVSDQKDGSQVFVDRGPSQLTITAAGNAHHDSGGGIYLNNPTSMYFDGSGDYIDVADGGAEALRFGYNDFTIELSFYATDLSASNDTLFEIGNHGGTSTYTGKGILCYVKDRTSGEKLNIPTSGDTTLFGNAAGEYTIGPVIATGQWYHLALCRKNGWTYGFLDGKLFGVPTYANHDFKIDNTSAATGGCGVRIGRPNYYAGEEWNGFIDDFRIINGKAIYDISDGFNPPSSSPIDTRAYGDVADYTKITMMGYRSDSSSYFTAINYVAGNEVVARDYMGIGYDELQSVAYSGSTQKIMVYNNLTNTVKFTAYVEATT